MRRLLSILFLLICGAAAGQPGEPVSIRHREEKYSLGAACNEFLHWDEVLLKNKRIENRINATIRTAVKAYKLSPDDGPLRCEGTMEYETECKVEHAKNGLLSYYMTAFTYYEGAPHGYRIFNTLNFDTKTGRQISFHDLIDRNKIADVDTLIMHRITERLRTFYSDMDPWKQQLPDLAFTISDKGIEILFRSDIYVLSIIGVPLSYEDLRPFVRKKGLLKAFYPASN